MCKGVIVLTEKKKIYYARTYRHLAVDKLKSFLYLLLLVIPSLIVLIINLDTITGFLCNCGVKILGKIYPGIPMNIVPDTFSILGKIEYIEMPTVYPSLIFVFENLLVMFVLVAFLMTGQRKGRPLSIYFLLSLLVHVINCIYFIFAMNHFPYNALAFSELYMKQQIGIWITFLILGGLVTGFLGSCGYIFKIITFFSIIGYSLIFGSIRYILFLFILYRFSILYMALMFFVFGPLFDFLYLVGIYSIFANKMVKVYDKGERKGEWKWS